MSKSVTLDGQIIHGFDRFGTWKLNSMEGWDETPSEKANSESRPLADGDYDAQVFYGPRMVTLNGRLSAKTPGDAFKARQALTALARTPAQFLVDQFGEPIHAEARRGRISPGNIVGRHLPFQMELRFIDPFKYGTWEMFSASVGADVAVFHRGNAPAIPRVVVSGSMPGGYTLMLAGSSVVVTEPLVSGSPHTIDYRKRRLYKGGAPVRGGLSTASYAAVEPGQRDTFSITPGTTGTATATMTLYDTYI